MKREDKGRIITGLKTKFEKANGVVLAEYKGLTVAELNALRDELRKSEIEFKVVKNTLARIAVEGTSIAVAKDAFKGPLGVAIGYGDAQKVAKEIIDFSKKNEKLKVCCGVIDGGFYNEADLRSVASLPSREVLLGMMAGTFQAPAQKMAGLLAATVNRLGYALTALNGKKEASGGA